MFEGRAGELSERQVAVLLALELGLNDGSVAEDGVVELVDAIVDGFSEAAGREGAAAAAVGF